MVCNFSYAKTGFFHDIISHQEEIIVLKARRHLIDKINESLFYSIICDETTDISQTQQFNFCVRHCNNNYDVSENFVGICKKIFHLRNF